MARGTKKGKMKGRHTSIKKKVGKRKHPKRRLKTKRLSKRLFRKNTRRGRSRKTRRYRKMRGGMMDASAAAAEEAPASGHEEAVAVGQSTSFGSAIKTHNPDLITTCNTFEDYKTLRNALEEHGVETFKQTETVMTVMGEKKLFSGDKLNINGWTNPVPATGRLPFTFFTVMNRANGEDQQLIPEDLQDKYIILRNKPEFGGSPDTTDTEWETAKTNDTASMSKHHQFVGVKAMDWDKFNALTFGYGQGGAIKSLEMLNELEEIATAWATARGIPPANLGCYFHIYPFNSVQSLHMHMVDTRADNKGAAWNVNKHKNMPLDEVRRYLTTRAAEEAAEEALG